MARRPRSRYGYAPPEFDGAGGGTIESDQVIRPASALEHRSEETSSEVAEAGPDQTEGVDSDAQLMWRLRRHDEEALAQIYDRHAGATYGLAVRMLTDRSSAEEVVQDAFLSLWRLSSSYLTDRGSVRNWLLVMVRSRAIDRLRPMSARARSTPIDEMPQLVARHDTWRAATDSLRGEAVKSALGRLPREQGQILEWAYFGSIRIASGSLPSTRWRHRGGITR